MEFMDSVLTELSKDLVPSHERVSLPTAGGSNNSSYSQQKPNSTMSIVRDVDFHFITDFFGS